MAQIFGSKITDEVRSIPAPLGRKQIPMMQRIIRMLTEFEIESLDVRKKDGKIEVVAVIKDDEKAEPKEGRWMDKLVREIRAKRGW